VFLKNGSLIKELNNNQNKYYCWFRKRKLDFKILYKIRKLIIPENINIVHSHQPIELFYAILLKLFKPRINVFHTIHGYNTKSWEDWLTKSLIRFTRQSFVVSNASREILKAKGYPVKKIKILYNAVLEPISASVNKLASFRNQYNICESDFVMGMIGSFVWQKDQLTIVNAYNILKDQYKNLKLIFWGKLDDNYSIKCKSIISEKDKNKILFLGPVKNAAGYLPILNLFIMSSTADTFGIVVMEALYCKIPVLASDISVFKELSHNGKYFELFKTGNPKDLAKKIVSSFNMKNSTTKSNIHKSNKYVLKEFNIEKYFTQINRIYKNLFQENHL
jgi:glycosyltransferase involved in cell wall biosynthesis